MTRLLRLVVGAISMMALAGCGDVEWFPQDGSSNGGSTVTLVGGGFTQKDNVVVNTATQSEAREVTGFTDSLPITVSGGDSEYSISGGAFTSQAGTIKPNQTLSVRHTSAPTPSTVTTTTIKIGTSFTTTFVSVTAAS